MDNEPQDTTGMHHHSQKRLKIVTALVGVVGGCIICWDLGLVLHEG